MRMENSFVVQGQDESGLWGDGRVGLKDTAEAKKWLAANGMPGETYRVVSVRTPLLTIEEETTRSLRELGGDDD